MEIYEAWSTFSETGNIMDYLRYTALKEQEEMKEDFPEYFKDGTEENREEDNGEDIENRN